MPAQFTRPVPWPSTRVAATLVCCALLSSACARWPVQEPPPAPASVPPASSEQKSRSQPVIRSRTALGASEAAATGTALLVAGTRTNAPAQHTALAETFRLLVWNVQKGTSDAWLGDFRTLSSGSDLVLLQEAKLHDEFSSGIAALPRWDMVQAWQWRRQPTGVLTASDALPLSVRALEHREPLLRTDKSALVTEYRIAGSAQTLMVANIHAINFTVDTRAFREQLFAVADLFDEHEGPVILSGDLNTWRAERQAIVEEIADALALTAVHFEGPRKQFRQYPLDHVYYRGLEPLEAAVTEVDSSDHNPLQVTFRVAGAVGSALLGNVLDAGLN
jgi:endonuclease/exonuclease/phosphatase (EEP) superfamily protein YafD